jgi:hypothetical protein
LLRIDNFSRYKPKKQGDANIEKVETAIGDME